jgi:uncharacterized protein (DUF2062 family)
MKNRYFYFNILRKTYIFSVKQTKKILGLNDSPHSIALGTGIGMFVAFTPTIPLQMAISFVVAWICRVNKTAAVIPAWVTNPITAPPIFYAEYLTGKILLSPFRTNDNEIDFDKYMKDVLDLNFWEPVKLYHQVTTLISETWSHIGIPLIIGSLIWAAIFGLLSYFAVFKIVTKRRERKKQKLISMKAATSSQAS